jgi:hypothetical protein
VLRKRAARPVDCDSWRASAGASRAAGFRRGGTSDPAQFTNSFQIKAGEGRNAVTTGPDECKRSIGLTRPTPNRRTGKAVIPDTATNTHTAASISPSHLERHDFLDDHVPDDLRRQRTGEHFMPSGIIDEESRVLGFTVNIRHPTAAGIDARIRPDIKPCALMARMGRAV